MNPVIVHRRLRQLVVAPRAASRIAILLASVLAYGTTGYLYWELPHNPALTWADSLWYSLVTMTTVGYGDFFPRSLGGRYLVGFPLMFFGISILGYTLSMFAAAFVTAKTKETQGMSQILCANHLLLVNFPGLAKVQSVLEGLRGDPAFGPGTPVVLIDEELAEIPPELAEEEVRFVRGNPARDETLRRANARRARHAVILSRYPGEARSDPLNVAIALAIEHHQPHIETVVECVDPSSEELLRKTGCNRIVCNARFEAALLSQELINPGAQEVMGELMSSLNDQNIHIVPIPAAAINETFGSLAARCFRDSHLLIGLRRKNDVLLNPPADTPLEAGDAAVTIGRQRPKLG